LLGNETDGRINGNFQKSFLLIFVIRPVKETFAWFFCKAVFIRDEYHLRFFAKDVTSSKPLVSNGVVMIDENLPRGLYFA